MKEALFTFFLVVGFVNGGLIPAANFVRTPSQDSTIVQSDQNGGNFAYSTLEGHAYSAVSPVGISYAAQPVVGYTHQAVLGNYYQPQPIYIGTQPIFTSPGIGATFIIPPSGLIPQPPITQPPVSPIAPVAPVAPPAPAPINPSTPTPPGSTVEGDSVSVESA